LTWTNIAELLTISEQPKRDFYLAMCAHEGWTKRTLRERVSSKLYERTVAARGSVEGVEADIAALAQKGAAAPAIVFRDPYVLDFLDLPPQHSESQLEQAILDEVERFMLELGTGFTFVAVRSASSSTARTTISICSSTTAGCAASLPSSSRPGTSSRRTSVR
jgi:predicted nuclease of restriction endonuclease-like (RecB) superfamily